MGHGGSRPRLIVTLFGRRPQRNPVVVRIYIGRAPLPLANKWDRQVEWATHVAVYRAWKDPSLRPVFSGGLERARVETTLEKT